MYVHIISTEVENRVGSHNYHIVGFICEVLICANFARIHELTNFKPIYTDFSTYVTVIQFANLKLANITARL